MTAQNPCNGNCPEFLALALTVRERGQVNVREAAALLGRTLLLGSRFLRDCPLRHGQQPPEVCQRAGDAIATKNFGEHGYEWVTENGLPAIRRTD